MIVARLAGVALLAGVLSIVVPAVPANATGTCPGASDRPSQTSLRQERATVLCLLNAERTRRGIAPLVRSKALTRAASGHSHSMVRNHYFDHRGPSGQTFVQRIRRAGYASGSGILALGENLAWAAGTRATPAKIVASWMSSSEHRKNVLDRDYEQAGIGIARGTPSDGPARSGSLADAIVVTADFGARS